MCSLLSIVFTCTWSSIFRIFHHLTKISQSLLLNSFVLGICLLIRPITSMQKYSTYGLQKWSTFWLIFLLLKSRILGILVFTTSLGDFFFYLPTWCTSLQLYYSLWHPVSGGLFYPYSRLRWRYIQHLWLFLIPNTLAYITPLLRGIEVKYSCTDIVSVLLTYLCARVHTKQGWVSLA